MDLSRYGEDGIRIVFGGKISLETNKKVRDYYFFLKSLCSEKIIDIIPSFTSCLVHFDNTSVSYLEMASFIAQIEKDIGSVHIPEPVVHEIPVSYGGEDGPDLGYVSSYTGLSEEEVVKLHTSTEYTVLALGFMPGFPYLGILDEKLYVPRLETPRTRVPKGSVGLAQLQTGIYSFESPGGWQIIGKTDAVFFNHTSEPYSIMRVGDKVRFTKK